MMIGNTDLAAALEEAVRATPGVDNVYRSGSLISNLVGAGAAALGVRAANEPVVSVVEGDDGVRVEAAVGVDFATSAPATLAAVRDAISSLLDARGLRAAAITLTVVYVHSREAS